MIAAALPQLPQHAAETWIHSCLAALCSRSPHFMHRTAVAADLSASCKVQSTPRATAAVAANLLLISRYFLTGMSSPVVAVL